MTIKHDNITIKHHFNQTVLDKRVADQQRYFRTHQNFQFTNAAECLNDYADKITQGYTLSQADIQDYPAFVGHGNGLGSITYTLRLPQAVIDENMARIAAETEALYRQHLAVEHERFLDAMVARELQKEADAERQRLAIIEAKAEAKRGQRVAALKAEMLEAFPA